MVFYVWEYTDGIGFEKIAAIDKAISAIWVNRHIDAGEFELYLPATEEYLMLFDKEILLVTKEGTEEAKIAMFVEKIELTTDSETGNRLIVSGSSAESILKWRIVMGQTTLSDYADMIIYQLLNKNAIAPDSISSQMNERRRIPNFSILNPVNHFPETADVQFDGETLLEAVSNICKACGFGFKVVFFGRNGYSEVRPHFQFRLYKGVDRTLYQSENKRVIFSSDFGNLGNTSYVRDLTTFANLIQVIGEGNGSKKMHYTYVKNLETKGWHIREKTVDGSNLSATTSGGELDYNTYVQLLRQKAHEEYAKAKETQEFSGEILDNGMYQYGIDYNLGDTVSIRNSYGIEGTAIVDEITEVWDDNGYRIFPTFSEWSVS